MMELTAEQRQIAKDLQVDVDRPADEVLALLGPLVGYDQEQTRKRRTIARVRNLALAGVVAGVIAVAIAANVAANERRPDHTVTFVLMAITGSLIVTAVVAAAIHALFMKADLSDNLTVAAVPFLTILCQDMNGTDPLHVRIDLRASTIAAKKKGEHILDDRRYLEAVEHLFVDPWFSGNAALADGTRVRWQVTEHISKRIRNRKSPSGRMKTKVKEKRRTTASVTLAFPSKQYAVTSGEVKSSEKRQTVTLERQLKSDKSDSPAFDMLIDLIAEGYKRVAAARGG
jgi:hypothetical protein